MAGVADELRDVVDELLAAGLPATMDPAQVGALLSAHRLCLLVDLPTVTARSVGGVVHLRVPVRLLGAAPGGPDQMGPVWAALPAAQTTLASLTADPEPRTIAGTTHPGYTLTTLRRL